MRTSSLVAAVAVAAAFRFLAPARPAPSISPSDAGRALSARRGISDRERFRAKCRELRARMGQPVEDALQEGFGA